MSLQSLSLAPGGMLTIEGRRYWFAAHPAAPRSVYALEASRATVYQVIDADGAHHALKIFKPRFRSASVVEGTRLLASLCTLPGLRAAERTVVTDPPDDLPDLQYAVLIPWIRGATWADLLLQGRRGVTLDRPRAVALCDRFLEVIEVLQARRLAHTDLSPANLVLDVDHADVQLVDLEDMYIETACRPGVPSRGSRGYQHPGGETCWHPDGDRYSATILAAEILLAADPQAMQLATDEYCFGPHSPGAEQNARAAFLRQRLHLVSARFAALVDRAWDSNLLCECPTAAELRAAILPVRQQIAAGVSWISPSETAAPVPVSARSDSVSPPRRPTRAPVRRHPRPAPAQSSVSTVAWVLALLILLFLIAVASASSAEIAPATTPIYPSANERRHSGLAPRAPRSDDRRARGAALERQAPPAAAPRARQR